MTSNLIIFVVLLAWNLVLFFIMGLDKLNSGRDAARVPEGFFMISALLMGASGVWSGMYVFHHKTRKWKFYLVIPGLFVFNVVLYYLMNN